MRDEAMVTGRPAGVVIRAGELRVWHDVAAMLADAEKQKRKMLGASVAAFEAERRRGYDEGLERGAEEMARRLAATGVAAKAALDAIEAALPALVCDAVENVLGTFDLHDLLRPAVQHALSRLRLSGTVTIRVAPGSVPEVRAACDAVPSAAASLRVEADATLALGRCLVESDLGTVELGLEAQLSILRTTLAAAWEQAP